MFFNRVKKILAIVLVFVMTLSLSACRDMTYIMKTDSISIPVGVYIYNEYLSYHDAKSKVESYNKSPLKQDISDSSSTEDSSNSSQEAESSNLQQSEEESSSNEFYSEDSSENILDESAMSSEESETTLVDSSEDDTESSQQITGFEWIKNEALEECEEILAIKAKLQEMGVSLSEDELAQAKNEADKNWPYYSAVLKKSGVSKESFELATEIHNAEYDKLLAAIYDQNGTQAIADEEVNQYFVSNYVDYQYISKSLMATTSNSSSTSTTTTSISDEEKADLANKFEEYANRINNGEDIQSISDEFVNSQDEGATGVDTAPQLKEELSISDEVKQQFEQLEEGVATFYKTDGMYYILYKQDINDRLQELTPSSELRISVLKDMKQDDFDKMIDEYIETLGIYINNSAARRYSPAFIEDKAISSSSKSKSSRSSSSSESSVEE